MEPLIDLIDIRNVRLYVDVERDLYLAMGKMKLRQEIVNFFQHDLIPYYFINPE